MRGAWLHSNAAPVSKAATDQAIREGSGARSAQWKKSASGGAPFGVGIGESWNFSRTGYYSSKCWRNLPELREILDNCRK